METWIFSPLPPRHVTHLEHMVILVAVCGSPGDEWSHPAAGVCGGVCRPVPDVRRLPSCGGQGLLEGRGSSQAEGRNPSLLLLIDVLFSCCCCFSFLEFRRCFKY